MRSSLHPGQTSLLFSTFVATFERRRPGLLHIDAASRIACIEENASTFGSLRVQDDGDALIVLAGRLAYRRFAMARANGDEARQIDMAVTQAVAFIKAILDDRVACYRFRDGGGCRSLETKRSLWSRLFEPRFSTTWSGKMYDRDGSERPMPLRLVAGVRASDAADVAALRRRAMRAPTHARPLWLGGLLAPLIAPVATAPLLAISQPPLYASFVDALILFPAVALAALLYGYVGMLLAGLPLALLLRRFGVLSAVRLCLLSLPAGAALWLGNRLSGGPSLAPQEALADAAIGAGVALAVAIAFCAISGVRVSARRRRVEHAAPASA